MGYDGGIIIVKKQLLQKAKEMFPTDSLSKIYSNFLFSRMYPDIFDFPKEETIETVISLSKNIFNDFFVETDLGKMMENDEVRIINEKTFEIFRKWLTERLHQYTLFHIATEKN